LETHAEDMTTKLFLTKANQYISNGVPENWIGVEEMRHK